MARSTSPIPPGFRTVSPQLVVKGAAKAIEFYARAFGARELLRVPGADGLVHYAELAFGDSTFMLSDELHDDGGRAPQPGMSGVTIHLYVTDADALVARARAAGATVTAEVAETIWGERQGRLRDPFGHDWAIATQVAVKSPAEVLAAADFAFGAPSNKPSDDPRKKIVPPLRASSAAAARRRDRSRARP